MVAYYEGCNGALVEVGHGLYSDEDALILSVSQNTLNEGKNGVEEGDVLSLILYRRNMDGLFWMKVGEITGNIGEKIDVCFPSESMEGMTLLDGNGASLGNGVRYAMPKPMPQPAPPMRFQVVNDSENEDDLLIINSIVIEPSDHFKLDSIYQNVNVAKGDTFRFSVDFVGDEDAEAVMYIRNNTKENPYVVNLVAESHECDNVNFTFYDRSFLVGIDVERNQSFVDFAVKTPSGRELASYNGNLGHGIQNREVPIAGLADSLLYLDLTMDGEQCTKKIWLKGKQSEDVINPEQPSSENACEGLVNWVNVNPWGTMVSVSLPNLTNLKMEVLNMNGTPANVVWNTQMMGAATHELYLNTTPLQESVPHILRVTTNERTCSMVIVKK